MKELIKITELAKRPMKGYEYSRLALDITGIDSATVNALRRLSLRDVPVYGFDPTSIDIEYNDSIYNNDMMRLRLSQLPIFNIKSDIIFLSRKYWEKVDFTDSKRERHPDDIDIDYYINVHNDTTMKMNVTTDHIRAVIDGKEVADVYKNIAPILIVRLRPNQTFKARLRGVLAIGEKNDIFAAASNTFFKKEDDDRYKLVVESQGQMDEYVILEKSCKIAIKKMQDIKINVEKNFHETDHDAHIELILTNEDQTIGNLINSELQQHKDIVYSGIAKPDNLIKEIKLKYYTKVTKKLTPLFQAIDIRIKLFELLAKEIMKVANKK